MLNEDRELSRSFFAGSILVRQTEAFLIHCIESYGRTKPLDAHNKSGIPPLTSLPPPTTRYTNVWPTAITDSDGTKLIIGAKSCSELTSSCRRALTPQIARSFWKSQSDCLATQIFLDLKLVEKAFALAKSERTDKLHNYDLVLYMGCCYAVVTMSASFVPLTEGDTARWAG